MRRLNVILCCVWVVLFICSSLGLFLMLVGALLRLLFLIWLWISCSRCFGSVDHVVLRCNCLVIYVDC